MDGLLATLDTAYTIPYTIVPAVIGLQEVRANFCTTYFMIPLVILLRKAVTGGNNNI